MQAMAEDEMTDPGDWKLLPPAFTAALRRYDQAAAARLRGVQRRDAIIAPLFHYTDRAALSGIITNSEIWFTHYQHLNDDKEIKFGMEITKAILVDFGTKWRKAKVFCDVVSDLFSSENLVEYFDFFIGCFSRSCDDVHQWKNYAAQGAGFSIGLAPSLFAIEPDRPDRTADERSFVSPVFYGGQAARAQHRQAIESAARIAAETAERRAEAMRDINRGMSFFRELANRLVASELILNCLRVKEAAWQPENEVRLFILGQRANLAPFVSTRLRGPETVPYIKHRMPLRTPGNITEILIGPKAPPDAEDFVCSLLAAFHNDPCSIVRRSTVMM
ncbi:Protein of unknown function [Acidocella aminolytica 101 = DSM 11237]|nr:Protein of unknown function [Acidocella aminolytica 101 = DSM 11237]